MLSTSDYINKYKDMAVVSTLLSTLLPSVKLAQAIIESSNGNSDLTVEYHNHFGIKSNAAWTGGSVDMGTGEIYNGVQENVQALFRTYKRDWDSYLDHTRFLQVNSNFNAVFQATTPQDQANAIAAGGYATDPDYATKIMQVIIANNLTALDEKKKFIEAYLEHSR